MNNPIRNIDPDGMWTLLPNGLTWTADEGEIAAFFGQIRASSDISKDDVEKEKIRKEYFSFRKGKEQSDGSIGSKFAKLALAGIQTDVATPDPTDGAWPKWVVEAIVGGLAVAYLHSNSDNNPDPHLVYEIFSMEKDGDYQTEKYSITSRADNVGGNNGRPAYQVNKINKQDPAGAYYWIERARTNERVSAKTIEVFLVSAYAAIHFSLPLRQDLPKPLLIK